MSKIKDYLLSIEEPSELIDPVVDQYLDCLYEPIKDMDPLSIIAWQQEEPQYQLRPGDIMICPTGEPCAIIDILSKGPAVLAYTIASIADPGKDLLVVSANVMRAWWDTAKHLHKSELAYLQSLHPKDCTCEIWHPRTEPVFVDNGSLYHPRSKIKDWGQPYKVFRRSWKKSRHSK